MARTRHQEGTVKITGKNKDWTGYFYVYDEAGGRHRRSTNLGPSKGVAKHEARAKLRVVIERETTQPIRTSAEDTVEWYWLQRFAPFQKWTKETRRVVEGTFSRHVLPTIGATKLKDLDKYRLQLLLQGRTHYSQSVLNKIRTYLWLLLEQAVDDDLIPKNPMKKVSASSTQKPTERYLTIEEIDQLFAVLPPRDKLICRIAIVMGLRPGELFALTWKDYRNGELRIEKSWVKGEIKETKTKASVASIWVPPTIAQELEQWRKATTSDSPYIFPTRKGRPIGSLYYRSHVMIPAAIRAGIMPPRPKGLPKGTVWASKDTAVNFQAMRRSLATWCEGDIKDVQALMRHANAATTLKYYKKAIPARLKVMQGTMDARLSGMNAPVASSLTM